MNGRLVWLAIVAGAAFNIALSLMMSFGSGWLFGMVAPESYAMLGFALRLVSALADIGAGAIAGFVARRDGPLHGGLASLLATVLMVPVSLLRMRMMAGEVDFHLGAAYWIDFALWTLVGIVLAAVAGFLAVEMRRTKG